MGLLDTLLFILLRAHGAPHVLGPEIERQLARSAGTAERRQAAGGASGNAAPPPSPDDRRREVVWNLMDAIDSKCSGLLTHISLLAAVVGVMLAFSEGRQPLFVAIYSVELTLFLFCGLICLAALRLGSDIPHAPFMASRLTGAWENIGTDEKDLCFRYVLYRRSHGFATLLTLALMITVGIQAVAGG